MYFAPLSPQEIASDAIHLNTIKAYREIAAVHPLFDLITLTAAASLRVSHGDIILSLIQTLMLHQGPLGRALAR